jgi:hypothetical protein
MTQYDIGPVSMRALVLGKKSLMSLHIVIEKKQNFALRSGRASVASAGGALVRLFQHDERKWRLQFSESLSRAIPRAIDDDDDLE